MTYEEKLNEVYYKPDHLWSGDRAIKELHRSWLAKQAFWQVNIPPPKEVNYPNYDVTKPNEQHQFDLLYMPHNLFKGNTCKYVLTGIDVA